MVEIVELFALAFISITPMQLSFKSVVFLAQVLFAEMFRVVASSVSPFVYFGGGYVCVLKVILSAVSIGTLFRQRWEASGRALWVGEG